MDIGKIFEFEYKSRTDSKPRLILLGESEDMMVGVNLNYIHRRFRDQIVRFINNEMLRSFKLNEDVTQRILDTNKIISEREFMRVFVMSSSGFSNEIVGKQTIKSKTTLSKILYGGFRLYKKEKLKNLKEISYK